MTETLTNAVHRFVVRNKPLVGDPHADEILRLAESAGLGPSLVRTARVYLVEGPVDSHEAQRLRTELLVDPVSETEDADAVPVAIEVHPLPGVMDPAAQSLERAVADLLSLDVRVSTGRRYEFRGITEDDARRLVESRLANAVVHRVHTDAFHPDRLPRGGEAGFELRTVEIRSLSADRLDALSRDAHLFLDTAEMLAIQSEYQTLDRDPTDIELETLAQTWSEHCVHKTLKSTIRYEPSAPLADDVIDWTARPGHELHADGSVTIHNLLRSTVAAATHELIDEGVDWTLSVFVDNAGIVKLTDEQAVCVKVETHNHPSAIEPYGGAATGIGGCIRDIIGTGLAAKPIANTDVFCVATQDTEDVPEGCLNPKQVLSEVVAGVRDYGNRMGIPTLSGAVWFDDRHIGNPLVFAGCVGLIPAHLTHGDARPGDLIVALGGRTGRDGIHGATFSSAELTETHADEFSHAVQIGNAIEEKRVLDAILRARDVPGGPLFSAITDCGAGGFSSAVGEMGEHVGAEVHLDRAPLKYAGLTYTEIWISEAQERMVLAVPPERLDELRAICDEEHAELAVLGEFGREGDHGPELILNFRDQEVGRLPMQFLHDGIPTPTRQAAWTPTAGHGSTTAEVLERGTRSEHKTAEALLKLLAHPNIASKHRIIRQYDHEVQGRTVLKPLVGPGGRGPGDAAVIEPIPGSGVGLAIGCGLATGLEDDPYLMALAAIDECVRNLVCVGADPGRIAILDNFCWPSCKKPGNLGSLVRAAEGCYDAAKAYRTPFVSGKDSLNNQFTTKDGTTIEIPPTLLITGIGRVSTLDACTTMDAKAAGNTLIVVGPEPTSLRGSHYQRLFGTHDAPAPSKPSDRVDIAAGPRTARVVAELIAGGHVRAAHDVSDGGLLVAVAEMLLAGSSTAAPLGLSLDTLDPIAAFAESPSRYVLEVADLARVAELLGDTPHRVLGEINTSGTLAVGSDGPAVEDLSVEDLATAWLGNVLA
ncbi:MAG: AIR synthase-related protein [Planctomycetota bacterium]